MSVSGVKAAHLKALYRCLFPWPVYSRRLCINPLNAELNPIRHLLALAGAHHFVNVSRVRVKIPTYSTEKTSN
jgi:hypothetical protein